MEKKDDEKVETKAAAAKPHRRRRAKARKAEAQPVEHVELKPFGWHNPQDEEDIDLTQVRGAETDDDGDLEFVPGNFAGVSPDRMFKAANSHGYPAWSEQEIAAEEEAEDEIEAHNKVRDEERKVAEKAENDKANKRLRDLINGA